MNNGLYDFSSKLPVPYQSLDTEGKILFVNNAWLKIMGYDSFDVIGKRFEEFLTEENRPLFEARFEKFCYTGLTIDSPFRMYRKDGSILDVLFNGTFEYDSEGNPIQTHCLFYDVTEFNQKMAAAIETEYRFRAFFDFSSVGLVIWDLKLNYLSINRVLADINGYSIGYHLGKNLRDMYSEEVYQREKAIVEQILRTREPVLHRESQIKLLKNPSITFYYSANYFPLFDKDGNIISVGVVILDISEMKKNQEAFQRELKINQAIGRLSLLLINKRLDISNLSLAILNECLMLTGAQYGYVGEIDTDSEQFILHAISPLLHAMWQEDSSAREFLFLKKENGRYPDPWGCSLEKNEPYYINDASVDLRCFSLGKERSVVKNFLSFPIGHSGVIIGQIALLNKNVGFTEDDLSILTRIAEFLLLTLKGKKLELIRNRLEKLTRLISDISSDMIGIRESNKKIMIEKSLEQIGGFFSASKCFLLLMNTKNEQLTLDHFWSHDESLDRNTIPLSLSVKECDEWFGQFFQNEGIFIPRVREDLPKNSSLYTFCHSLSIESVMMMPFFVNDNFYGCWCVEVTISQSMIDKKFYERYRSISNVFSNAFERLLDEQIKQKMDRDLLQSARLASVGELAAGIAHEINNPLAIILGYVENLERRIIGENITTPAIFDDLETIKKSVDRMSSIIGNLRSLIKIKGESAEIINVHTVVDNAIKLIRELYRKRGIEIELVFQAHNANIWAEEQKVHQIILNLLSNSRDAFQKSDNNYITIKTFNESNHVVLAFSDNGSGIKKEIFEKVFDSFFTTKEVGKGTGLGLSLTHSFVTEQGGTISLASEEGKGTTVTIRWPFSQMNYHQDTQMQKRIDPKRYCGKVLLVEDEFLFRQIMQKILTHVGFEVTVCPDGKKAYQLIKDQMIHFDIILTDLKMPNFSGDKLINLIVSEGILGDSKIVIMTGCVMDEYTSAEMKLLENSVHAILRKPFKNEQLYEVLDRLMVQK